MRETDFERNSRDYSWQTKSRSKSRESLSRRRSSQTKFVQSIETLKKEKQLIRQRLSFFHSQNNQKLSSIKLQNVQSADRWIFSEKFLLLKKSRRLISLRSFIESSFRSISVFFILSLIVSSSSSLSSSSHQTYREKSSTESFKSESFKFKSFKSKSFKSIASIRIESGHEKELANLAKLYIDEAKYSHENDSFSFKLTIFHDMCDRADVLQSAKLKTFLIKLKDLALDYYYSNMFTNIMTLIIFDEICFQWKTTLKISNTDETFCSNEII